jgi:hypothetical protein
MNKKPGAHIHLAENFYGATQGFDLRFYQEKAQASAFRAVMKPFVKLKKMGACFFHVKALAVVGKRNNDPLRRLLN